MAGMGSDELKPRPMRRTRPVIAIKNAKEAVAGQAQRKTPRGCRAGSVRAEQIAPQGKTPPSGKEAHALGRLPAAALAGNQRHKIQCVSAQKILCWKSGLVSKYYEMGGTASRAGKGVLRSRRPGPLNPD